MRDGNFSQRSEINQHLRLYNNFFTQRLSPPDNEQINTGEGCFFSWGRRYGEGRRIPRIRREGNWITLSPNSASTVKVPLSRAPGLHVKQTCSVWLSRSSSWIFFSFYLSFQDSSWPPSVALSLSLSLSGFQDLLSKLDSCWGLSRACDEDQQCHNMLRAQCESSCQSDSWCFQHVVNPTRQTQPLALWLRASNESRYRRSSGQQSRYRLQQSE